MYRRNLRRDTSILHATSDSFIVDGKKISGQELRICPMKRTSLGSLCVVALACAASITSIPARAQLSSNVTVIASGLQAPRGLKFGPDGMLYVAEEGTGGTTSTKGACPQVIAPIGPYTAGTTSRISKFDSTWHRTTVASAFPSAKDAMGDIIGVQDLAFMNGTLYGLLGGGGCSHGAS